LGDGQIHRGKDNAGLKDLILADKGVVISPDSGQDGTNQDEGGNVMKGRDRVRVREKKAADVVRCPGSFLHISRKCALPYFQLLGATEKEVLTRLHIHSTDTAEGLNHIWKDRVEMKARG